MTKDTLSPRLIPAIKIRPLEENSTTAPFNVSLSEKRS